MAQILPFVKTSLKDQEDDDIRGKPLEMWQVLERTDDELVELGFDRKIIGILEVIWAMPLDTVESCGGHLEFPDTEEPTCDIKPPYVTFKHLRLPPSYNKVLLMHPHLKIKEKDGFITLTGTPEHSLFFVSNIKYFKDDRWIERLEHCFGVDFFVFVGELLDFLIRITGISWPGILDD